MTSREQVLEIPASATSFTATCEVCATQDSAEGFSRSTFAGRLELDLDHGTFLCRRGQQVRVQRVERAAAAAEAAA
jgi:hypothetical protein